MTVGTAQETDYIDYYKEWSDGVDSELDMTADTFGEIADTFGMIRYVDG